MTHRPDTAMALDAARAARACAARMRLPLRRQSWRGGAGEMAGAGSGSSLDFQDHRNYIPGDDPRHLNWAAYARTGNYSMKLFREEVSPTVEVLFDASSSMFLDEAKARLTCGLLAFVVEAARRDAATLIIHLLDGSRHLLLAGEEIDTGTWTRHVATTENQTYPPVPPRLDAIALRSGSMRVWITDLLFPASPATLLRPLVRQRGSGVLLVPFSDAEAAPEWDGVCDFQDVETGRVEARDADAALRNRYLSAYRAHFSAWKEEAVRHHLPLARVSSGPSLAQALSAEALATRALEPAA
jgi:uncharacterized protein (DUF58 family)